MCINSQKKLHAAQLIDATCERTNTIWAMHADKCALDSCGRLRNLCIYRIMHIAHARPQIQVRVNMCTECIINIYSLFESIFFNQYRHYKVVHLPCDMFNDRIRTGVQSSITPAAYPDVCMRLRALRLSKAMRPDNHHTRTHLQ